MEERFKVTEDMEPVETGKTEKAEIVSGEVLDTGYYIKFKKPYIFEDEKYTGVDLTGLEDMNALNMIKVQRQMERAGSINTMPELSLEYALLFAAEASGKPVEFFQQLPPREASKIKNRVINFLYGED